MGSPGNLEKQTNNSRNDYDNGEYQEICSLIYLHLKDFYDNICISYHRFKNSGWQIEKVIYENGDFLFLNNKFVLQKN
ncbi:MAG: hypothetical protein QW303_02930, partial [Nitrososphaerota archaeon]